MPYLTYDKVSIFLTDGDVVTPGAPDYEPVYAVNFASNNAVPTTRLRRVGSTPDYYNQTGPKSTSFSASVVPTFNTVAGTNQLFDFFLPLVTGDFNSGSYLKVPDMVFERVYLSSLSFDISPWKPLVLNLRLDAFGSISGTVAEQAPVALDGNEKITDSLRGITAGAGFLADSPPPGRGYQSLSFSFEAERQPEFNLGTPYAVGARLTGLRKRVSIRGCDDLSTLVDFSPDNTSATVTINLLDGTRYGANTTEGTITVTGRIVSQDISVSESGVASGSIEVLEETV